MNRRCWRCARLAGDLAGLNWSTLQTALVPALIGLGVALLIAPRLNVLALGDKVALGLGVNLVQTRLLGLLAIALLCGAAVAVAGPIGFVGLVVPHVVRRLVTEDIRLALPWLRRWERWRWCWRISPPGRWSRRRSWRPGR